MASETPTRDLATWVEAPEYSAVAMTHGDTGVRGRVVALDG